MFCIPRLEVPIESSFSKTVIAGLGLVVIDELMFVERFPEADTKTMAAGHRWQVGGPVPTALAQLAKWGYSGRFAGRWGNDAAGRSVTEQLHADGLECHRMGDAGTTTARAHVWIDRSSGARTTVAWTEPSPDAAMRLGDEFWLDARVLLLDGRQGAEGIRLARSVREANGLVAVDAGTMKPELFDLLEVCDILQCPWETARVLTGEASPDAAAQRLLSNGVRWCAVTDGCRGAWLAHCGDMTFHPAFRIAAVDTNGAGDVFAAGLIHGVLCGWPPAQIVQFASATSAHFCRGAGNRESMGSLAAITELAAQHPPA